MSKLGSLVLVATLSAAVAQPVYAHGGGHWHHHGGDPFYPIVGLAGAVVGAAAAIVTLPFAIADSALRPAPYYAPPATSYYTPPATSYYAPPVYSAPPAAYYPAQPAYAYPPPPPYYAPRTYYYGGYRY